MSAAFAAAYDYEGHYCKYESDKVARSCADPDSVNAPVTWKDNQERDEEYQLACKRQKYGDLGFADTLEEVLDNDLTSNQRIEQKENSEAVVGNLYQLAVNREQA